MTVIIYLLLWAVIFYLYGKNRQLKTLLEEKKFAEKEREDQLNNFLDKFGGGK